jgi:hypothetical protein
MAAEAQDDALLRVSAPKALRLLGFTSDRNVNGTPPLSLWLTDVAHLCLSAADAVVAEPNNPRATAAMAALVEALIATRRVAIVRLVKRERAAPKLGVLGPCGGGGGGGLIFSDKQGEVCYLLHRQLPCVEDVRQFQFTPPLTEVASKCTLEQRAAAEDVIDAMDLESEGGG